MTERLTVTVSDGLYGLVEGLSDYSHRTGEVPSFSRAAVFRMFARDGAAHYVEGELDLVGTETDEVDEEILLDLVPDHVRARYMRDEIKDENWLAYMRGGFEDRVRDALTDVFSADFTVDEAEEVAEGFRKEARLYWEILEDEPEVLDRKLAFVDDALDTYAERREATTWDPDEEFLAGFDGVEAGETEDAVADVREEIRALAADRLRNGGGVSATALADSLAHVFGVPEEAVREIVDDERRENTIRDQLRDSGGETPEALDEASGTAHDALARAPNHAADDEPDGVEVDEDDPVVDMIATDGGEGHE